MIPRNTFLLGLTILSSVIVIYAYIRLQRKMKG